MQAASGRGVRHGAYIEQLTVLYDNELGSFPLLASYVVRGSSSPVDFFIPIDPCFRPRHTMDSHDSRAQDSSDETRHVTPRPVA